MDYTLENGKYYKVLDADGELIAFGELVEGEVLSSKHNVEFISKEEFEELSLS